MMVDVLLTRCGKLDIYYRPPCYPRSIKFFTCSHEESNSSPAPSIRVSSQWSWILRPQSELTLLWVRDPGHLTLLFRFIFVVYGLELIFKVCRVCVHSVGLGSSLIVLVFFLSSPVFIFIISLSWHLHLYWGEDVSNMSTIPTQHRASMQILKRDTVNPSETSNLRFRSRVVLNNSVFSHNSVSLPLRTEMGDLESQEVDAPKSILWY